MAKDRARPFSRKHRRYWIPVTGGMLLLGAINVAIGAWTYETPREPQRIELVLPRRDAGATDAPGTLGASQIPAAVMRAFAAKYPRTIPSGIERVGTTYVVGFPAGSTHRHATFGDDGEFVSED